MGLPRILNKEQIAALSDTALEKWYKKLKMVRQSNRRMDENYENPKAVRWCYYEARRELTRRGLRDYKDYKDGQPSPG
jgi:hypothetical protein